MTTVSQLGVLFTDEELHEFQGLCAKHFGSEPTLEEAKLEATRLIELVSLMQPVRASE